MNNTLLPPSAGAWMRHTETVTARLSAITVALRTLWTPTVCPVELLPYLAWALSVDRWDKNWTAAEKRKAITDAYFIHRRKGTIAAVRRAIEAMGYTMSISEWWLNEGIPGTFSLVVDVSETGISDKARQELERVINDTKPVSRHMNGLSISNTAKGIIHIGCVTYFGDVITVYPDRYIPESDVTYNASIKYNGNHTYSGKKYG
ncbi:phage tail protein I [Serratia quinivorans]|uniref:phage tail protein I n=1 Tax=Serratia quinivorans TaxID=137545 RepID=UPI003981ED42